MIIETVKKILIVFVSSIFLSCNGQTKLESKQTEIKTGEIGKTVSEVDNQIWSVFQDKKGNYWFGSNGRGIYHFDGKTLKQFTTADKLVGNQIRGIQEDNKGNIYIETPLGISKFNGTKFTTLIAKKSSDNQWKLEPNDLWFGYNANDLYRYNGTSLFELKLPRKDLKKAFGNNTEGVPFESNNGPYAVYGVDKDKDGNIWFGTVTAGAFRYDGKSFLWFDEKELSTLPDGRVPGVRSMIQDKDGYFWLSNFYSKYKINPNLPNGYEKLKAVDLPQEIVKDKILYFNSGIADEKGNLWMTTYSGGVWKYNGKTLSNFEINNGKEDVLLIYIYQDNNGTIWLGTNNDGVYKQTGENFQKFEPKT
ncbi:ligand-binding sensor domain-containing protein [Aquimarina sp. 2201CG5-10]|uniref:ligand-binding sensor domain-containing protein n=1 Tax=Aquimarina callyspongiae TaxID=3098150 RepID=UPI002AB4BDE9|nr:two-component regulator propeller domain-containing protein [Aquimarina sp. 2201CG5-10]MDY8135413.1 two-component regulator propeller domain-containing protein [Aquimarina sp. 2201CG5-10]